MNQLDNTHISSGTLVNSTLYDTSLLQMNDFSQLTIPPSATIFLGNSLYSAKELENKLLLLDRLIAQFFPEELI